MIWHQQWEISTRSSLCGTIWIWYWLTRKKGVTSNSRSLLEWNELFWVIFAIRSVLPLKYGKHNLFIKYWIRSVLENNEILSGNYPLAQGWAGSPSNPATNAAATTTAAVLPGPVVPSVSSARATWRICEHLQSHWIWFCKNL